VASTFFHFIFSPPNQTSDANTWDSISSFDSVVSASKHLIIPHMQNIASKNIPTRICLSAQLTNFIIIFFTVMFCHGIIFLTQIDYLP